MGCYWCDAWGVALARPPEDPPPRVPEPDVLRGLPEPDEASESPPRRLEPTGPEPCEPLEPGSSEPAPNELLPPGGPPGVAPVPARV
jgi:hypothetical protein